MRGVGGSAGPEKLNASLHQEVEVDEEAGATGDRRQVGIVAEPEITDDRMAREAADRDIEGTRQYTPAAQVGRHRARLNERFVAGTTTVTDVAKLLQEEH